MESIMAKLDKMLEEKETLLRQTEYPRYKCASIRGYIEAIKYCKLLLLEEDKNDELFHVDSDVVVRMPHKTIGTIEGVFVKDE